MTPERWEKIKAILSDALERPASERELFVRASANNDPELLTELIRLLEENERDSGMLSHPAVVWNRALDGSAGARFSVETVVARRFRIVRFIASGGMGEVYEAEDLEIGGRVALKAIRRRIAPDEALVALFKREIQLARRVTHPNVCRIFDAVQQEDAETGETILLLSMELLDGQTLSHHLRQHGAFAFREAMPLIEEIAAGLQSVHDAGVIHGDLKPGNVMLASRPGAPRLCAVVMDFGLASPAAQDSPDAALLHGRTPEYSAPEQVQGAPMTTATDVYCLALVIADMLGVPRPSRHKPDSERMPSRWARVLRRCLNTEPGLRYARPAEVARILRESIDSRRRMAKTVGTALAILAAAAAAIYPGGRAHAIHGTASRLLLEEGDGVSVENVSPDGRFLATTSGDSGDLVLRDLDGGKLRRLTHSASGASTTGRAVAASFSRDSRRLAYLWMTSPTSGELHVIGSDGSGDRTLYAKEDEFAVPLDWLPNGQQILVQVSEQGKDTCRLMSVSTVDASTTTLRSGGCSDIAHGELSPDGKIVVYQQRVHKNPPQDELRLFSIEDRSEVTLLREFTTAEAPRWTPDGEGVVFLSDQRLPGRTWDLWRLRTIGGKAQGPAELVKADISAASGYPGAQAPVRPMGRVTRGGTYYYRQSDLSLRAFTVEFDPVSGKVAGRASPLSQQAGQTFGGRISRDGHLMTFFRRLPDVPFALVIRSADTNEETTVATPFTGGINEALFPDAKSMLVTALHPKDGFGFYRLDTASGAATLLKRDAVDLLGSGLEVSPDGKIAYYVRYSSKSGESRVIAWEMGTGKEVELFKARARTRTALGFKLSADGNQLAITRVDDTDSVIEVMPAVGGSKREVHRVRSPEQNAIRAWSPDGRYLVFVHSSAGNGDVLQRIPMEGGLPQDMGIAAVAIGQANVHPNGRRINFVSRSIRSEIWALENFLPRRAKVAAW